MKTKRKIYAISVFFSFMSLVLIVFLIYPAFKSIESSSAEIRSSKNGAFFMNLQIEKIDNFKKKYDNYKENFQKIDQLFIDSQNPVEFIKFLEKSARDYDADININLISHLANNKTENNPSIIFLIKLVSDSSSVLKFSEKLENAPYLISIQNLTIKKPKKLTNENIYPQSKVEADFTIEAAANYD